MTARCSVLFYIFKCKHLRYPAYSDTYDTIRELEPNATVVMNGLPVEMKTAETGAAKQVEKWLKSLSI